MDKETEKDENDVTSKKKKKEVKLKDTVVTVDPELKLKGDKSLGEAAQKTAVFTFGRMNPPTTGHEKLIHKVHSVAKQHNAKGHVITSHSHDSNKNPLPQNKKIDYIKKIHPNVMVHGSSKQSPSIFHHASNFHKQGYKNLVMVVGSDRVKEFDTQLKKYNGVKGAHGHYNFDSIKVVSAGDRDPDAEGVSGISGTKMRTAAKQKDMKTFKQGLPKNLHKHADEIAKHIAEEIEDINQAFEQLSEVLTVAGRRKKAIAMRRKRMQLKRARMRAKFRFAGAAQLKRRARRKAVSAIKRRVAGKAGQKYASISIGQKSNIDRLVSKRKDIINRIAQRNAPKVRRAEAERLARVRRANEEFEIEQTQITEAPEVPQDPDIAKRKGTQPAKYHKGLSKSTKAKRDAQFKKQTKMDDDNPAAYKPAPGDKTAKTKPSKFTKQYHAMYGEVTEMEYKEYFDVIDMMIEAVDPAVKARHEREKKQLQIKHTRERARSKVRGIRREDLDSTFESHILSEKSMEGLKKKAEKTGISYKTLKKVYDRGVAAWRTGHRPGTTPSQWGYGRVNAFIAKRKSGKLDHDKDLA